MTLPAPPAAAGIDESRWRAVSLRDATADGAFVYAVTSTGVFCRPSCPSRRPRRERVRYFDRPLDAERAGFRPCRRCHPENDARSTTERAIQRVAEHLANHAEDQISLASLGAMTGLSPSHLQRQFKRALGVSPREYQAACRAARFREQLRSGQDVTTAIYAAGYGSPSRVYEAAPTGRGISPSAYGRGGVGEIIGYSIVAAPLGRLLVAATAKGICAVMLGDSDDRLQRALVKEFPRAEVQRHERVPAEWTGALIRAMQGMDAARDLPLDVRGTAFQWRVWRALQRIPPGETRTYSDVARAIGQPTAARAVARACATNPACLVVPCHRVVAKNGDVGGYRWGIERKRKLLAAERATPGGGRSK